MNTAFAPWQQRIFDQVSTALDAGRLGHALLFTGPAGLGKRAVVERLAQQALCTARAPGACLRSAVRFACRSAASICWFARNQLPCALSRSFDPSCRKIRMGLIGFLRISVGYRSPPGTIGWPSRAGR